MFLRVKRVNGLEYLLLVENHRENGLVRQRTIRYYGRTDHLDVIAVRHDLSKLPGFAFLKPRVAEILCTT